MENTDVALTQYLLSKKLSGQEIKIAKAILLGLPNKVIAEKLFISVGTVKYHITNIYKKFKVPSRAVFITTYHAEKDSK